VSGLVTRILASDQVRVVKTWLPAHARYYSFLGIALEETAEHVRIGVYGYLPSGKGIGVAVMRREKPLPIPPSVEEQR
jgi:hypothetical protein